MGRGEVRRGGKEREETGREGEEREEKEESRHKRLRVISILSICICTHTNRHTGNHFNTNGHAQSQ